MSLSPQQQSILDMYKAGNDDAKIIKKLGVTPGVLQAQKTRLRGKGYDINGKIDSTVDSYRDKTTSSNSRIVHEAAETGPARYDVDQLVREMKASQNPKVSDNEVNPMIFLGVTIQYMKLCGGRMQAHQMIEDVYGAMQARSQ